MSPGPEREKGPALSMAAKLGEKSIRERGKAEEE
jgi:hypothetical protein